LPRSGFVQTRYNKNGQEVARIQYYHQIATDPSSLTTNDLIETGEKIRNTEKDKATYRVLDAIGLERFVLNAEGCVTEKIYDATPHRVTHEIEYAVKIENPE